ncbi:glycine/D-amino acid oxidase-like deaminating enzyme [Pseudochelatococcus lubricantis]|uniref:Glycine/D-amino acid oxidase-like deaminating enzyme n=1 Tax=Pseudochelatococcus lubricantis TaxID=1538102 RepID=A0ABX0V0R8_9HYPH|nr:FAD-dependent oxidoreductase [Pseudochelatococcus lubricantis]NIJ58796.1 glycine/D-amino acid oxidase-like deaminating enzyme [Pseudochelatococcus lubricantis]
MTNGRTSDIVVIGGGLIGTAVAFGLRERGLDTVLLDEGDVALRAARGNFGLVWLQSKGAGLREYTSWTRKAVDAWPGFASKLRDVTGIDVRYRRPGGYHLCLSDAERDKRAAMVARIRPGQPHDARTVMLERDELKARLPFIGPSVVGGSYNPLDGDCNSLALFRALHEAYSVRSGDYRPGQAVRRLLRGKGVYGAETAEGTWWAPKVVIAAGLGLVDLGRQIGVGPVVHPQQGQIIVTERVKPFLDVPISQIRQTPDGTLLVGDNSGGETYETPTSLSVMHHLANRAVRMIPELSDIRIVRSWVALRVLSKDGAPVYQEAPDWPGVFFFTAHSSVTLAPMHVTELSRWVADGAIDEEARAFSTARFS